MTTVNKRDDLHFEPVLFRAPVASTVSETASSTSQIKTKTRVMGCFGQMFCWLCWIALGGEIMLLSSEDGALNPVKVSYLSTKSRVH